MSSISITSDFLRKGDLDDFDPDVLTLEASLGDFDLKEALRPMRSLQQLTLKTDEFDGTRHQLPALRYLSEIKIVAQRCHFSPDGFAELGYLNQLKIEPPNLETLDLTLDGQPFENLLGLTYVSVRGKIRDINALRGHLEFNDSVDLRFYSTVFQNLDDGLFASSTLGSVIFENADFLLGGSRPFEKTSANVVFNNSHLTSDTLADLLASLDSPKMNFTNTIIQAPLTGPIAPNTSLKELTCTESELVTPPIDPAYFSALTAFAWDDCSSLNLTSRSFSQPALKRVRITRQHLSNLPQGILQNALHLELLDLSHNLFTDFTRDLIRNSAQIKALDLSWNELRVAPLSQLQHFPHLRTVNISFNKIKHARRTCTRSFRIA